MQSHRDTGEDYEYTGTEAIVFVQYMIEMNNKSRTQGVSFVQQYLLRKGLKLFGDRGREATKAEIEQLHERECFAPMSIAEMSPSEKERAMGAIMFLAEKRSGAIKGRLACNGKPTREWLGKEDSASPTASLESVFLTAVIDAHEGRDTMTADTPNVHKQTELTIEEGQERSS